MQTISIQKASALPQAIRDAVEQLLGRPIAQDEEVSVAAVPPQQVAPFAGREFTTRRLEAFLDRRAVTASGISTVEMDRAIDEAVHYVRHSRS